MVSAPCPVSRRRGSGAIIDKNMANRRRSSGVGTFPSAPSNGSKAKDKEVGQFVLSKTMGEGTFGEVKLATHKPTSEKVAAKVLEKGRIKTIADVKRVSREIKILKRVRHPNVILLYEVLDTPSTIYFMMEHCDGGELFDYIVRHQRLHEPQACFFFRQLVDGIQYLHENDVTHRDLKPENLLLQSSADGWRLKIIDFGLSNTHEGGRMLQTACGSPCYAAPEMIAGKSYQGPTADVWSCGVVLFTLVSGFLPFEDPNTAALYKKILSGSYEKPRWLSEGVLHLLSRLLHTDPAKRAGTFEIRAHAWYEGAHPLPDPQRAARSAVCPCLPSRRADIDQKTLARALVLTGRATAGPEVGDAGSVATAVMDGAVEGLLTGRHDAVGTAYRLLLKRKIRNGGGNNRSGGGIDEAGDVGVPSGQAANGVDGGNLGRPNQDTTGGGLSYRDPRREADSGTAVTAVEGKRAVTAVVGGGIVEGNEGRGNTRIDSGGTAVNGERTPGVPTVPGPAVASPSAARAVPRDTRVAVHRHTMHGSSSSSSSSRSGQRQQQQQQQQQQGLQQGPQQPPAWRRNPRGSADTVDKPAAEDTSLRGTLGHGDPTSVNAGKGSNTGQKADPGKNALESPAALSPTRSYAPAPLGMALEPNLCEDRAPTRLAGDAEARPAQAAGNRAEGGGGKDGRSGDSRQTARRPIPLLSFRGITRTTRGGRVIGGGSGSGSSGRLAHSAVLASQTARTAAAGTSCSSSGSSSDPNGRSIGLSFTNHDRRRSNSAYGRGQVGQRRESIESSSSRSRYPGSRGGNGGGSWKTLTAGRTAPPRRPLTARAPLRSSAPTPRLSGDFSLARPRGEPIAKDMGSGRCGATVPSPNTAQGLPGSDKAISEAPTAARTPPSTASTTAMGSRGADSERLGGGAAQVVAAASAPSRSTGPHQPSLRVRLSTVSARLSQPWRDSASRGGGAAGCASIVASTVATAGVATSDRRASGLSRPSPRRPSPSPSSSCSGGGAVATVCAASAQPMTGGTVPRALWSETGDPGGSRSSSGCKNVGVASSQVTSAKSWARGAPIVLRQMS